MFWNELVVMVAQHTKYTKSQQIIYFKRVNFKVRELELFLFLKALLRKLISSLLFQTTYWFMKTKQNKTKVVKLNIYNLMVTNTTIKFLFNQIIYTADGPLVFILSLNKDLKVPLSS